MKQIYIICICVMFVAHPLSLKAFKFEAKPVIQVGLAIETPKHEIGNEEYYEERISTQTRFDPWIQTMLEIRLSNNLAFITGLGFNYQVYNTRHEFDMPEGSLLCPDGGVKNVFVSESRFTQNHVSIPIRLRYYLRGNLSLSGGVDLFKYSELISESEVTVKNLYGVDRPCEYYIQKNHDEEDLMDQYEEFSLRWGIGFSYHLRKMNVSLELLSRNDPLPESRLHYPIISDKYLGLSIGYQIF